MQFRHSKKTLAIASIIFSSTILSACAGPAFSGPIRPVRLAHVDGGTNSNLKCVDGKYTAPASKYNKKTKKNYGGNSTEEAFNLLAYRFSASVCKAIHLEIKNQANATTSYLDMLDTGGTLIRSRCNDYFAQKATNQTRNRVRRSSIAPITTAITGLLGVIDFSSEGTESDFLSIFSIGSAALTSGLDIYKEQFLFSSENISSVRRITIGDFDNKFEATLNEKDLTFNKTARHLMDLQEVCTPSNILELVKVAIKREADLKAPETPAKPATEEATAK